MKVRILAAAMATLLSGALFAALVFLQLDVIKRRETVDAAFDSQLVARPEIHNPEIDAQLIQETDKDLLRQVDFKSLKARSEDVDCWVYLPDTNVDFPVMQEPDNMPPGEFYYLWRDIDGIEDKSKGGSIFKPYVPLEPGEEPGMVTIMFGHRMKNRELAFSNMKLFLEQDYFDAHPYVYVYYPDRAERYEVWAACNADYRDEVYRIYPVYEAGSNSYQALLTHIGSDLAKACSDRTVTNEDELLVLSTCYQDDTRMFLAAVLDRTHYYNGYGADWSDGQ